jgi:hypothetical protein
MRTVGKGLEHLQRCSVGDPGKIFFTSKFSYVLFCNPTHKTETGTANMWGTPNSKPPGRIITMEPIRDTEQELDHIHYTHFTGHGKEANYMEPKPFS